MNLPTEERKSLGRGFGLRFVPVTHWRTVQRWPPQDGRCAGALGSARIPLSQVRKALPPEERGLVLRMHSSQAFPTSFGFS